MIPEDFGSGGVNADAEEGMMMSDVRKLRIDLAMVYLLYVEDYEKCLYYLDEIKSEYVSVENLRAVAEALLGDKGDLMELEIKPETDLRELENSIAEEQRMEYYRCLMKGYALLDTEQAAKIVLSLGEACMGRLEDGSAEEIEVKEYMASALEKVSGLEEE